MNRTMTRTSPQTITARPVTTPAPVRRVAGEVPAPRAPMMSLPELGAAAREVGGAAAAGAAALAATAISDAIVERTTLSEPARAVAQGMALGVVGAVVSMTGARAAGRGLIAAGVVSSGLRFVRAKQWDRAVGGWIARKLGTLRPEERAGAGVWSDDPDIRVEAMADG